MLEKDACKLRFAEMLEVRGRMGTVSRKTTAALSRLILYPQGNESARSVSAGGSPSGLAANARSRRATLCAELFAVCKQLSCAAGAPLSIKILASFYGSLFRLILYFSRLFQFRCGVCWSARRSHRACIKTVTHFYGYSMDLSFRV